ncbi:alpha/beta hydrolase [Mycolicibacterium sp. P9-64]|uniref:alpha/beta hydrolase n=1 Tax=Mycolicibacterium sp. P9-64 TaxID=2024612 RepID=UPI0011EE62DA|nr:alpha/beta hydrolase [Mycolicibacterium sp. P9-64]KAA0084615.1 alpha/beta hydrolase [Mycolicibacterium sp. P9-64]
MSLDPQIAEIIDALDEGFPAVETMPAADVRATIRSRLAAPSTPEAVGCVENRLVDVQDGQVPIRIYRPEPRTAGRLPILVYAHGGGFVFCDLDSHDGLCRNLANRLDSMVISVGYRLAPEHAWPTCAEDVYAVTEWVSNHIIELDGDPSCLMIGGDSAGGNLAAVATLMVRDRGGPALSAQLLLYPMITPDFSTESYRRFGRGYYNPEPALRWYWDQYVPNEVDRDHPYASPLHADLAGLPPAVVAIAGHDPLRDEGLAYGQALVDAGVHTTVRRFEGGIHGFMTMPMLDLAHEARAAVCQDLRDLVDSRTHR